MTKKKTKQNRERLIFKLSALIQEEDIYINLIIFVLWFSKGCWSILTKKYLYLNLQINIQHIYKAIKYIFGSEG